MLENFVSVLAQLPPGISEVMVHPAIMDDELQEIENEYLEAREIELNILLDSRVRKAVEINQIQLIRFSEIKEYI